MDVKVFDDGGVQTVHVALSQRNVEQLHRAPHGAKINRLCDDGLLVVAVEDDDRHYDGREPGPGLLPFKILRNPTSLVLLEVMEERRRQDERFPDQHLPNGTADLGDANAEIQAKARVRANESLGILTWRDILDEEVAEAFAEREPSRLREELIQVAAVAVRWVEDIDHGRQA